MSQLVLNTLSHKVLGIAFKVHNYLGPGLHESTYEEAFCSECLRLGLGHSRQHVFAIEFNGRCVGSYIADLVVENAIILEFKSVRELNKVMFMQLLNYLKLSGLQVGYLFNFANTRVEWQRFVNTRRRSP